MVGGALFEERFHRVAQLGQPPVALDQFLPDVLVLAQLDQIAHRFAQALDGQSNIVLHQFRAADAKFRPLPAGGAGFRRAETVFSSIALNLITRSLNVFKKLVGFIQNIGDEFHRGALAQGGEQALFRARIPEPVQRVTHLAA